MNLDIQEQILLQELIQRNTIDPDVLEALNNMKKVKVLEIHTYKITPPKNDGCRWQTYVWSKEQNTRIKVSAEEEKTLFEKLYNFYFPPKKDTMESLYPIWLEKRKNENVSPRTIKRNQNHWDKYYVNSSIIHLPLEKLTTECIEDFLHSIIRDFYITAKELKNMQFIITDMLKMARKKKLMSHDPFQGIEIKTEGCKTPSKKSSQSRIYLPQEKEAFFQQLKLCISQKPAYTDPYAILLLFKLGLRIGELAALKWCDINYEAKKIHIHRMETLLENKQGELRPVVVPYTKKKSPHGDRFLALGTYELGLFKRIKEINDQFGYYDNDFIYCDINGRTKIREFDYCIRTTCQNANIPEKSAHDIRRTVASEMFNVGHVPVEVIRDYLGHSDIKTTWDYIIDNHEEEQTNTMILDSLKGLNGFDFMDQEIAS